MPPKLRGGLSISQVFKSPHIFHSFTITPSANTLVHTLFLACHTLLDTFFTSPRQTLFTWSISTSAPTLTNFTSSLFTFHLSPLRFTFYFSLFTFTFSSFHLHLLLFPSIISYYPLKFTYITYII